MRGLCIALTLGWLAVTFPASLFAQTTFSVVSQPILTVNSEFLFEESAFGKRVSQELEAAQSVLLAENRKIQAELTAEEKALAAKRPTMTPVDFRAVANEFDARVN